MKISLEFFTGNVRNLMREAGYHPDRVKQGSKISFSRSLLGSRYPRFHAYYDDVRKAIFLHLDQKASRYKDSPDHAGEYHGKEVQKEAERIKNLL